MAISRVEIQNFLAFQGDFAADFCPGINVLIGSNGTGKTTLMKVLHWACESIDKDWSKTRELPKPPYAIRVPGVLPNPLGDYFVRSGKPMSPAGSAESVSRFCVYDNEIRAVWRVSVDSSLGDVLPKFDPLRSHEYTEYTQWAKRDIRSVFIPTADMLVHSETFLALARERHIPFDKTEIDILAKAELGETLEITPNAAKVLDVLKEIIGGEVSFENGVFYIDKGEPIGKVSFGFEASGFRKLGLLWKLLRNGLLESGSVLFWDEPENSLNPEHVSALIDVLLELSRNGVQIFLATHSELLASYVAVNRKKGDAVLFTSLYKEGAQIKADADTRFDLLEPNNLITVPIELYKKELKRGLSGSD